VFHLHFHVIPRYHGKDLGIHAADPADQAALAAHAARIRAHSEARMTSPRTSSSTSACSGAGGLAITAFLLYKIIEPFLGPIAWALFIGFLLQAPQESSRSGCAGARPSPHSC
jgi:hypothetical protein